MRCVILDDYQGIATAYADWSELDGVEVEPVHEHLAGEDAIAAALDGASTVVVMRERTPLVGALLDRLPDLRLVVTSGMRNAAIHPLRSAPNVLATPHLGHVSAGNYRTYFTEAVEDIAAWLADSPIRLLT